MGHGFPFLLLLSVALITLSGCVDEESVEDSPDAYDDCHFDCFGYVECVDGVVTVWSHTPVPCEYWEGECPHAVEYECLDGCGVSQASHGAEPSSLCVESEDCYRDCVGALTCDGGVVTEWLDTSVRCADWTGECPSRVVHECWDGCERSEAESGASPDSLCYQDCHFDCFGFTECEDGVVTVWEHTPVPCEYWEGECPHYVERECEEGCATRVVEDPWVEPSFLCWETAPKQAGDPCETAEDCLPQIATVEGLEIRNVYLTCDTELGECVDAEPPVVEDWLEPCDLSRGDLHVHSGYVTTDVCSGGVCIYAVTDACVLQGCSTRCTGDHECPMGSLCVQDSPYGSDAGVCKPGPERAHGVGLECPE